MVTTTHLPPEIEAARAVLAGELPPIHCIGYRPNLDQGTEVLFLAPEQDLESLSQIDHSNRNDGLFLIDGAEMGELERAFSAREPKAIRAVCESAIGEALKVLAATAGGEPYGNLRLGARVCQAIRAELAALVADWEAVGGVA